MASGNGTEVLVKSVTAGDYPDSPRSGIFHFTLLGGGSAPDLPPFWSPSRDFVLYNTLLRESMWASAIGLAITKLASQDFDVESDVPERAKRAQELFLSFDSNKGWVGGLTKHLLAYLLTGNGGPVEIVRATAASGSKILGLIPLDTFRAIRTGNPEIPIIYRDRLGREHEMHTHQVFILSDMPDQADTWYGVGHPAAERAYNAIIKLESIERYLYEKVSGKRALALDFISGVLPSQIEGATTTARAESIAKGVVSYMGSTIIALAGDVAPVHVRVNLAELPDGFNRKEEFDIAILTYARAIGIPVQDLQPLSGQGLGTGTQSIVLDDAAKGMGSASWRKQWEHASNNYVLDERTTFTFRSRDMRDKEREAKVRIDEASGIKTWVDMGAINAGQALQIGVDRDQLPKEFIPVDATAGEILSDDEKPEAEAEPGAVPVVAPASPAPIVSPDSLPPVTQKDYLTPALRLYAEMRKELDARV